MAFDAGMLYAVIEELRGDLLGLRVEKVHQPTKDEVVFLLRGHRLSINIGSVCPRIAKTAIVGDNPSQPPMLCMLLRKHLVGAILEDITQCGYDRVVRLTLRGYDEMGYVAGKHLYAELMGKYSNLILTDDKDKIIAVAKPIDFSDSDIRQLLPGLTYAPPPVPDKRIPFDVTKNAFFSLQAAYPADRGAVRFLTDTFAGTATVVAREIVYRAAHRADAMMGEVDADSLYESFCAHFDALRKGWLSPTLVRDGEGAPDRKSVV